MTFKEVLAQVIEWLQENKPISYRALKRQFDLVCQLYAALILWLLGFPGKALQRMDEARTLAQELSHPFSLGFVFSCCLASSVLSRGAGSSRAG